MRTMLVLALLLSACAEPIDQPDGLDPPDLGSGVAAPWGIVTDDELAALQALPQYGGGFDPPPGLLWCVPLAVPTGCPAPSMTCLPLGANIGVCRSLGQYLPDLAICSSSYECGPGATCNEAPDGWDRCLPYCDAWDGAPGCEAPLACGSISGVDALGLCSW